MQFSLDRFFDVVAERLGPRFGPPISTVLLVLMCLAMVAFFLNVTVTQLVQPVAAYLAQILGGGGLSMPSTLTIVTGVISIAWPSAIFWAVVHFYINPRERRWLAEFAAKSMKEVVERTALLEEMKREWDEAMREWDERIKAVDEKLKAQVSGIAGPVVEGPQAIHEP